MKKLLLSVTAFAVSSVMYAQIYTATTAADYATWTKVDGDGDGFGWVDVDFASSGINLEALGQAMESYSWDDPNQTALTPNNLLVSPSITCTGQSTVWLSWTEGSYANATYSAEHYAVYVVTNPASLLGGAFPVPFYETTLSGEGPMAANSIDISSIAGGQATVYVVFRHYDCTDKLSLVIGGISLTNSEVVGLEEVTSQTSVYPNPANNVLNFTSSVAAKSIAIISLDGKVLSNEMVSGMNGSVNVETLSEGVYFYELSLEDGSVIRETFVKK